MVCGRTVCGELIFSIKGILDVNEAKTGKERHLESQSLYF